MNLWPGIGVDSWLVPISYPGTKLTADYDYQVHQVLISPSCRQTYHQEGDVDDLNGKACRREETEG
jgi:hypothetical protein